MEPVISLLLTSVLAAIAVTDWKKMIIPNTFVLFVAAIGIFTLLIKQGPSVGSRIVGCLAASIPMIVMNGLINQCFGWGDIKLCASAGLLLGVGGMLLALFLAVVTGGSYAVYLLVKSRENRKCRIPFGPFLAFGIWTAYEYGEKLTGWYLNLLEGGWFLCRVFTIKQ